MDLRLHSGSWKKFGDGVGKNKSLKTLTLIACNLNQNKHMYEFMNGVRNSKSLQKISFPDSELYDEHGIHILNMIKYRAEKRDITQFHLGLR